MKPLSEYGELGAGVVMKLYEVANEYHMARGGGVLSPDDFGKLMTQLLLFTMKPKTTHEKANETAE